MEKLYKNSVLYLVSNFIINGAGFLLLPLYTTLISPNEFGTIYLIEAAALFLSRLISLSLRGSINRFYFEDKSISSVKKMYSTIINITFIISVLCYSIIFLFYNQISVLLKIYELKYLFLGLLVSFFNVFYPLILGLLYAKEEGKKISITITTIGLTSLLFNVLFVVYSEDKVLGYLQAILITSVLKFGIFIVYSKPYFIPTINFKAIPKYLKYGLHLLPSDLSGWVISFIDRFMINSMKGAESTGIYSTGYKVGQASQIVYDSVNKAYVPFVFSRYEDPEKNKLEISKSILQVFSLYTFVATVIALFYKEIIFILDERYSSGANILLIIVFAYLFDGYRLIFNTPISYNVRYVKYRSIIFVSTGIFNIFLNLVLIPKYSITGAAIAILITFFIRLVLIFLSSLKAIKINYPYRKMLLVIVVSLLFLLSTFLSFSVINILLKFILIIILILILLKICSLNLRTLINDIFKRKQYNQD